MMELVRLALRRPYTVAVLSLLVLLLGVIAAKRMIVDFFPKIDIPVVFVGWQYTGLSAEEMERRVVIISERAYSTTVAGIERIESNCIPGVGLVKVFFELNGQARTMRVEKAGAPKAARRVQAELGNVAHVAAPMPGMIVTVSVKVGQQVKAGDPLVSIEAMKMESQIRADRDGIVRAVHVRSGDTVAARDLMLEFAP